jgi:tetratricopeptide (TPR) repeat protein
MKRLSLMVFLLAPLWSLAQTEDAGFLAGVSAYRAKDYERAKTVFTELMEQNPDNPILLYNLGLVEYQLGRFGWALGLWRKARTLAPGKVPAEAAIAYTEERLFPERQKQTFIVVIYNALLNLPSWLWRLSSLLGFMITGWWGLEYGVKRRLPPNLWPSWIYIVFPLFLLGLSFTLIGAIESMQTSATVVEKDLLARVSPSETSPTILQLEEGQKVTVDQYHGEWARIHGQNGAPGWVPRQAVLEFKGN